MYVYLLLRPSCHLDARVSQLPSDRVVGACWCMSVPIVSSTSAGRGADEVKARVALSEANLWERGRLRNSCWRIMLCVAVWCEWCLAERASVDSDFPSSGVKFPFR